jgi:hypothetical protein
MRLGFDENPFARAVKSSYWPLFKAQRKAMRLARPKSSAAGMR